jgi:hypothetical protein
MKTILLSLAILIFNVHLSSAQTKKIALRSHSGANSSFTIDVPDEFGLGPSDYQLQKLNRIKKCSLNIKPIKPSQIQIKDSLDSIQICTPIQDLNQKSKSKTITPKSKPSVKKKKAKKATQKKTSIITSEIEQEEVTPKSNATKTQLAGFSPSKSSESLLIWLLSIPALLFLIVSVKNP